MNKYITGGLVSNLGTNFTAEQVMRYANNYLKNGMIMQDDYDNIITQMIGMGYGLYDFPDSVQNRLEEVEGVLTLVAEAGEVEPSLEKRVEAVEGATEEVITILNDKGIAP